MSHPSVNPVTLSSVARHGSRLLLLLAAACASVTPPAADAAPVVVQSPPAGRTPPMPNPHPVKQVPAAVPESLKLGPPPGTVRPGISVLMDDSLHLIRGKRIALLTNQNGIDERGISDIDRLFGDARALAAKVTLVRLFAPEHGIRGTEDRLNIENAIDQKTGLPVISLYTRNPMPPPDSLLRDIDVLLVDLQDLGARPWTFPASMLYAVRAAGRNHIKVLVLDRPNPITGTHVEGPIVDSALTNPDDHTAQKVGRPTAIFPIPLRHGMTMGEMARFYNVALGLKADLTVIPAAGWTRDMWFDDTGLPWVKPSPNMPSLTSAMLYPGMVTLEPTNISVGRGTSEAFQLIGAPWMDVPRVLTTLEAVRLPGVRLSAENFTPVKPGDSKYSGRLVQGIRITVTNRDSLHSVQLAAAVVWAVGRVHPDSLKVRPEGFDRTFGKAALREALLAGVHPDSVLARETAGVAAFRKRVSPYLIYR